MISLFKNWVTTQKKNTASNSFYLDKTGTDSAHCSETLDKKGEITKWTTFLFIIFCTTIEIKRKVAGRELEVDFFIWAIYIVWLHIKTIR